MRSIKRRFLREKRRNPLLSSYLCFAEAVREQNFSRKSINHSFLKLVDKSDYDKNDQKAILNHLVSLSKEAPGR